jgi:hypothetical protein
MKLEPGQAQLDSRIAESSVEDRVAWSTNKRQLGLALVWQQLDASGIEHPVEQAGFLLRRLYPEMPEAWFGDVLAKLAAKHAAGEWHGFERPSDGRMEAK